jgi:hypothetical protein
LNRWIAAVQDAALSLEVKDGTVIATSPKGAVQFQSLDPGAFPYWDDQLSETEEGTKVEAKRLHAALSHTKMFISDKDTTTPKLAVTEVLHDSLQSTDKGAFAAVTLREAKTVTDASGQESKEYRPTLKGSNLRIHGKDISSVLSFLSTCGEDAVEIREHDRCLFLIREDGSLLNVGRPRHAFPDLEIESTEPPHWWELKTSDVKSAILTLAASAAREDHRITCNFVEDMVTMQMSSSAGAKNTLHLEPLQHGSNEDGNPLPGGGFEISYPYLLKLLSQYKGDSLTFDLYPQMDDSGKHRGGWTRIREVRGDDEFLTILVWLL